MSKQVVFAASVLLASLAGCAGGGSDGCPEPCASTQACCDGRCVFTQIDPNHCGGCGMTCNGTCGGGVCTPGGDVDGGRDGGASMCRPECAASQRCCPTGCVERAQPIGVDGRPGTPDDPRSPFNNCGACGLRCDPERANSCSIRTGQTNPSCSCGDFGECVSGDLCVHDGGQFRCVNLSTSTRHCGVIGNACAEGEICVGGNCVCGATGGRCAEGQACCGGQCIDTSSDAANCGGCGQLCTPNAPNCVGGSCTCAASGRACEPPVAGGAFGGGSSGESCCPGTGCVANTDTSCGCTECTGGDECVVGGSGFFGGGGGSEIATVCCGDPILVAFAGCGGFGFPGFGDGGFGFDLDAGFPSFDGGVPFDGGTP